MCGPGQALPDQCRWQSTTVRHSRQMRSWKATAILIKTLTRTLTTPTYSSSPMAQISLPVSWSIICVPAHRRFPAYQCRNWRKAVDMTRKWNGIRMRPPLPSIWLPPTEFAVSVRISQATPLPISSRTWITVRNGAWLSWLRMTRVHLCR